MASYTDVLSNNESLKVAGSGVTAVFVGATTGIGLVALQSLTRNTEEPAIYVVGDLMSKLELLINDLQKLNDTARFIPIESGDLTLVKNAEFAAFEITKTSKRVDLLIMSPECTGISRVESPEGLNRLIAVRHYSRIRFLLTLAPLLRASPSPRVVAGGGGKEGQLWPEDWQLQTHWSMVNAAGAADAMQTLFFDAFAQMSGNKKMVFVHVFPGMVEDIAMTCSESFPWWARAFLSWLFVLLAKPLATSAEEAGERVIFAATNGRFRRLEAGRNAEGSMIQKGCDGQLGSGVYLVQKDSGVKTEEDNEPLKKMRRDGLAQLVYEHTLQELDRISKM